jgi:hypothetical protein
MRWNLRREQGRPLYLQRPGCNPGESEPNGAKIPNVCAHFGIACTNFEGFLKAKGWSF